MTTSTRITRRIEFDAGHRVYGHEGKCAHLHGHRYVAEITVSSAGLDVIGRVVDFSVIKDRIGMWIMEHWDHNLLLSADDPLATLEGLGLHNGRRPFVFQASSSGPSNNPTAEVMAEYLFWLADGMLPKGLDVERVRIYETPNCWADYSIDRES